ncbi:MAG: hypothetical protein HOP03_04760 [Lysobacter sp.]|nr:hypothetical protein [Lysobacter sp.]
MSKHITDSKHEGDKPGTYKLELVGLTAAGERPDIAMQVLDNKNAVLLAQNIDDDGRFNIPTDVLDRAHRVVLGAPDDKTGIRADALITYRAGEFLAQIADGRLALAERIWSRLRFHWTCVSGSVRVCKRRRWWFESIVAAASPSLARRRIATSVQRLSDPSSASAFHPIAPSLNELIYWPYRCAPVCRGIVEVYRRTCCCWPIVFDDIRIPDLIRDLERYVVRLPKWPGPTPDVPTPPIGDPLQTPFFKGGALNELPINAASDLRMLRSLPSDRAAEYIQSRAYLFHRLCRCGQPSKVGTGTIQPDGSFNICWPEPWRLLSVNCYEQYAYVVKQTIGSTTTTLYNGLTADAWFAAGDEPVLTSYNSNAFACNETGTGGGDAYVFLDLIGDTESHELTTPTSAGWDRVATPDANSGLLFPGVGPNNSHLRNLGGRIELTFVFSLGMRDPAVGAHYYRISICQADADGNPTGPRHYHGDGLAWDKIVGADIVPESLGPVSVGGETNLYRIPYSDEPWVGSVRYHALIDTTIASLNAPIAHGPAAINRMITLEVFDAGGKRLRPLGAPASGQPGTELAKPFKYRRWFQPGGSVGDDTIEVPFAALTHLFCWDNRPPVADILQLKINNITSNEECQFWHGPGDSTFAIEYSAYVPDERFQYAHDIAWLRGLNASAANGGIGALPTPLSPANAGKPPSLPAISGSNTFEQMLTRLDAPNPPTVLSRCAFAVTLTTYAKTTNGEDLSYPYAPETAAFALAID